MARLNNDNNTYLNSYYAPPNCHSRSVFYFEPYYYIFMVYYTGVVYTIVYRRATTLAGLATAANVVIFNGVAPAGNIGPVNGGMYGLDVCYNESEKVLGIAWACRANDAGLTSYFYFRYATVADSGDITLGETSYLVVASAPTQISLSVTQNNNWVVGYVISGGLDYIQLAYSSSLYPASANWISATPGITVDGSAGPYCITSASGLPGDSYGGAQWILPYIDHTTGYWNVNIYSALGAPIVINTGYFLSTLPSYNANGMTFSKASRLSTGDVVWAYKNRTTGAFYELQYHHKSQTVTQHLIANLGTDYYSPVMTVDKHDIKYFMANDPFVTFQNVLYTAQGHDWTDRSASLSGDMLSLGNKTAMGDLTVAYNNNQLLGNIKIVNAMQGQVAAILGVWVGEQAARINFTLDSSAVPQSGKAPLKVKFESEVGVEIEML